jgi:hypothetical protein
MCRINSALIRATQVLFRAGIPYFSSSTISQNKVATHIPPITDGKPVPGWLQGGTYASLPDTPQGNTLKLQRDVEKQAAIREAFQVGSCSDAAGREHAWLMTVSRGIGIVGTLRWVLDVCSVSRINS